MRRLPDRYYHSSFCPLFFCRKKCREPGALSRSAYFAPFRGNRFTSLILHLSLGRLGTTKHTNDTIALFIFPTPFFCSYPSSLIASCSRSVPGRLRSGSAPCPFLIFLSHLPFARRVSFASERGSRRGIATAFPAPHFSFLPLGQVPWEKRVFLSQDAVRNESGSSQDYVVGGMHSAGFKAGSHGRNADGTRKRSVFDSCSIRGALPHVIFYLSVPYFSVGPSSLIVHLSSLIPHPAFSAIIPHILNSCQHYLTRCEFIVAASPCAATLYVARHLFAFSCLPPRQGPCENRRKSNWQRSWEFPGDCPDFRRPCVPAEIFFHRGEIGLSP